MLHNEHYTYLRILSGYYMQCNAITVKGVIKPVDNSSIALWVFPRETHPSQQLGATLADTKGSTAKTLLFLGKLPVWFGDGDRPEKGGSGSTSRRSLGRIILFRCAKAEQPTGLCDGWCASPTNGSSERLTSVVPISWSFPICTSHQMVLLCGDFLWRVLSLWPIIDFSNFDIKKSE